MIESCDVLDQLNDLLFFDTGQEQENTEPELEVKFKDVSYATRITVERLMEQRNVHAFIEINEDIFINNHRYTKTSTNTIKDTTKRKLSSRDIALDGALHAKVTLALENNINVNGEYIYNKSNKSTPYNDMSNADKSKWDDMAISFIASWNDPDGGDGYRRKKKRKSYFLLDNNARVDITEVTTIKGNNKGKTTHEIEVELIGDIEHDTLISLANTVLEVDHMINMSIVIADYNRWVTLDNYFPNMTFLNKKASPDPRNFKKEDFVWDGLLPLNHDVTYTVTPKGDGERKNLVVHSTGIWFVRPKVGYPNMQRITSSIDKTHKLYQFIGTVLDGELIPTENLTFPHDSSVHHFYPFDCMSIKGSPKIQQQVHVVYGATGKLCASSKSRMFYAAFVGHLIKTSYPSRLSIQAKQFFDVGMSTDTLTYAMQSCTQYFDTCGFINDGYIFTPNNYRYKTIKTKDMKKYVGKTRTLLHVPDICKLKPWDKLSIDFVVKGTPVDYKAYVVNDKMANGELIEFTGSQRSPFNPLLNMEYPNDSHLINRVIEMEPYRDEDNNIVLKFQRVRDDKSANSMNVAIDVWKDLQSPIHVSSLYGHDFKFMRMFMNQVKDHLISSYPTNSNILDIGSGNGGDLYKLHDKNPASIVAIDPNTTNMTEYIRRMNGMKWDKTSLSTLSTGGENTQAIVNACQSTFNPEQPTIIQAMLSLSFFWSNESMLRGLATTIASVASLSTSLQPTYFIFYTIDGFKTRDLFIEHNTRQLTLGPSTMTWIEDNIIDIDYPSSIIVQQREYLVVLEQLETLLKEALNDDTLTMEIEDIDVNDKRGQYIMSPEEKTMASLYVVGKMKLQ